MAETEAKLHFEIQYTFWYEVFRLASFLRSKRLFRWTDKKVIMNVYCNGKFSEAISFDVKKVLGE